MAEPYAAISNPVVFLSHSVNLVDSPLIVQGFPRPVMSIRLWRSFRRGGFIGNRCSNCLSHRSRAISASIGEPASLNCWFSEVNSRSLGSRHVCCLCNVFIYCTSSSTVAIMCGTDGQVNNKYSTSLNCEGSDCVRRAGERKTISVSTFSSASTNLSPISHHLWVDARLPNKIPPTVFVHTRCSATMHDVFI